MANSRFIQRVCLLLLSLMLIPVSTIYGASAGAATNSFSDLKGHWAEADIQEWLDKGLVTGYPDHTFRPEQVVSRGEFVALVNRAFQFTEASPIQYKDLKQGTWVYEEVQKAVTQGYISGFSDHTFRSKQQITRQETAVMLARILDLKKDDTRESVLVQDASSIPSWSKDAIQSVLAQGIMSTNQDGAFQPQRLMTRADSVVAIKKALEQNPTRYQSAGTYGNDDVVSSVYNVRIQSAGVKLKNMHVKGDLTITQQVGEGNVYLDQVQVDGITRIEGGGKNSIHFNNSVLGTVIIDRAANTVRIVTEGTTTIQDTQIISSAILEESGNTGDGFINVIVLPQRSNAGERSLSVAGNFNTFKVNGNVSNFTVVSGIITQMTVGRQLSIQQFTLNRAAVIQTLDLNSKATISGDGQIFKANLADEAKGSVVPTQSTSGGGGGGFFGGGGIPTGGGDNGTQQPETPPLAVTSIAAVNGTIDVLFNQSLSSAPSASDFTVFQKVDNGDAQQIEISKIELLANTTTVRLTVPALQGLVENNQSVVYSLSYKGASTVAAPVVTVSKSTSTVTGRVMYQSYATPTLSPMSNQFVYLMAVEGTNISIGTLTNQQGQFTITSVAAGKYAAYVYVNSRLVLIAEDTVTVEAGKDLAIGDLIYKQPDPVVSVTAKVYSDTGYVEGAVLQLNAPFKVKVQLADGTELNTPTGPFNQYFTFNLLQYNPNLELHADDKLYFTFHTDGGWTSERYEVLAVKTPRTKSPTVTSVVYDEGILYGPGKSIVIRGTVEDPINTLTVRTVGGTVIASVYNIGTQFKIEIGLSDNLRLAIGDRFNLYAQTEGKLISEPANLEVQSPTAITERPRINGVVTVRESSFIGTAEKGSEIVVKRSDGTVIQKTVASGPNGEFLISITSDFIAGETIYITARAREKLISDPISLLLYP